MRSESKARGWRDWYQLNLWRNRRAHQIATHPLCAMCLERGIVARATVADHVEEHNGDWTKFRLGALQSLCATCHNSRKRLVVDNGFDKEIGVDGWPVDRRHPVYRERS